MQLPILKSDARELVEVSDALEEVMLVNGRRVAETVLDDPESHRTARKGPPLASQQFLEIGPAGGVAEELHLTSHNVSLGSTGGTPEDLHHIRERDIVVVQKD